MLRVQIDMPVKVKICGITRPEDAVTAARLGADAVGFIFWKKANATFHLLLHVKS